MRQSITIWPLEEQVSQECVCVCVCAHVSEHCVHVVVVMVVAG